MIEKIWKARQHVCSVVEGQRILFATIQLSTDLRNNQHTWRHLYLLIRYTRVRNDELGSERDRLVNFEGSVNQRFREFWVGIPGCGRNLEVPFRTPEILSRNRDRRVLHSIFAKPYDKRPETQNARRPISRLRALTGGSAYSVEPQKAPPARLELATRRLTAACSTN